MSKKKRTAPFIQPTRCTAHSKSTGEPCGNPPMEGQTVCRMHGGATKAARARAEERIAAAADPSAAKLVELMQSDAVPYSVQLAAAKDLLDRAGIGTSKQVEVAMREFENFAGILVDVADDDPRLLNREPWRRS